MSCGAILTQTVGTPWDVSVPCLDYGKLPSFYMHCCSSLIVARLLLPLSLFSPKSHCCQCFVKITYWQSSDYYRESISLLLMMVTYKYYLVITTVVIIDNWRHCCFRYQPWRPHRELSRPLWAWLNNSVTPRWSPMAQCPEIWEKEHRFRCVMTGCPFECWANGNLWLGTSTRLDKKVCKASI